MIRASMSCLVRGREAICTVRATILHRRCPAVAAYVRCGHRIRPVDKRWTRELILQRTGSSVMVLCVAIAPMLRQEKFVQQRVNLQQAVAMDADPIALEMKETP